MIGPMLRLIKGLKPSRTSADRRFRVPRIWSNRELAQFAHLFSGSVVNVSGWTDIDKEGSHYREYFRNASEYRLTNFSAEQGRGYQGLENEIFLDLEAELLDDLRDRFDVVFNHTTLEHVYECRRAFANLCSMSRDVVIVVVPYIQEIHVKGYLDYWRFTPYTMKKLYEENGLTLRYCSANGADKASIYLFCIGYRDEKWHGRIPERFDLRVDETTVIGGRVIS